MYWEQAMVCSCLSVDSGQPDFSCPLCKGRGYRYLAPEEIIVGVQSLSSTYKLGSLELYEPGTCMVTPMSNVIMGYQDRLTFPDFKCKFSEVLRFNSDEYKYGVSKPTYREILSALAVADDKYMFEEGVDYEITGDGRRVRWLSDALSREYDKKSLSILYFTTPVYLVVDIMHELRGTRHNKQSPTIEYHELQKQYKCQREQFAYYVSTPSQSNEPDNSEGEGI